MSLPYEISVADVKARLEGGGPVALIDVREPFEQAMASIAGAELIPMQTVPARLGYIGGRADEAPVIVICHHGVRSLNVVTWLRGQGVGACQSMAGGIDAWSALIDPGVPRY